MDRAPQHLDSQARPADAIAADPRGLCERNAKSIAEPRRTSLGDPVLARILAIRAERQGFLDNLLNLVERAARL